MNITYTKVDPHASIVRAHRGDAGADLTSVSLDPITIRPGEVKKVGTGIAVDIPLGYVGLLCSRSGQASAQVTLANSVGIIDHGYQGEIKAAICNRGMRDCTMWFCDRIAQLLVLPVALPEFVEVEEFSSVSERGTGGFGSTGV